MSKALEINEDNFESEILGGGVGVVDFGATWCGPCKALAPVIDELAGEYAEKGVKIGKCDVDESANLAGKFGIMSVPTVIFFKDGEKVDQIMGNQPKGTLVAKIEGLLGS